MFGNTTTNSSNNGSLFGNNNSQNTTTFGQNNNNTLFGGNTNNNSTFINSNTPNNAQGSLFGNNNQQGNNVQNNGVYNDITYQDIINPLGYINDQKIIKLTPQDEILSKSIAETIEKQKSVQEFLDDLDKKYQKKTENLDDNSDILTSYGTYLTSSNTFETNEPSMKRYLNVAKNNNNLSYSYNDKKYRNWINNYNESSNYNKIRLNQSIMKINEIYDEYKRYTSNFNTNLNGNMNFRNNFEQQELNNLQGNEALNENMTINNKYRTFSKNNKNEMIGRNEGIEIPHWLDNLICYHRVFECREYWQENGYYFYH